MVIAICADTHDNIPNCRVFLSYCQQHKIKTIFHCGDWSNPDTLDFFMQNFKGNIYGVLGNAVISEKKMLQKHARIHMHAQVIHKTIGTAPFSIVHKPKEAHELATKQTKTIIVYGHTHKPWIETEHENLLLNPGTLSGMFMSATFAIYDTNDRKARLIRLMDLGVHT